MKDKINLSAEFRNTPTFLSHAILSFCSSEKIELLKETQNYKEHGLEEVEIKITLNGVEVTAIQFEDMFKLIYKSIEMEFAEPERERIKKAAKEMLEEKLTGLQDKLCNMTNDLDYILNETFGWN